MDLVFPIFYIWLMHIWILNKFSEISRVDGALVAGRSYEAISPVTANKQELIVLRYE